MPGPRAWGAAGEVSWSGTGGVPLRQLEHSPPTRSASHGSRTVPAHESQTITIIGLGWGW